jgi:hypothetical protein
MIDPGIPSQTATNPVQPTPGPIKSMHISDQAWAFLFVLIGCAVALLCRHYGMTETLGATIVGGGLNALTKAEYRVPTVV